MVRVATNGNFFYAAYTGVKVAYAVALEGVVVKLNFDLHFADTMCTHETEELFGSVGSAASISIIASTSESHHHDAVFID